jgi:exosortase
VNSRQELRHVNTNEMKGNKRAQLTPVTNALVGKSSIVCRPKFQTSRIVFWLKVGLAVACILFLFWKVWVDMAREWWSDPTWSQGILLPPLAFYIAWIQRHQTLARRAAPDARGLPVTAFACLTFVTGNLASEFFLMRLSFVILLVGIVWTFWGLPRLRTLTLPLLLLATMIPLPAIVYNQIAAPLQLFVSDVSSELAQQMGIAVFRDGNIIQLANTSLGVAEACSGISSLSALTVGSILLGYLVCSRRLCRIAVVLVAIPLAICVNIVRVAGTALLADHNQDLALGLYHSLSGWLIFVIGFGLLYLLARLLHRVCES